MRNLILILSIASLVGCAGPVTRLTRNDVELVVDFKTLGEYLTTVTRIRLRETDSERVVWEIVESRGTPQLWEFRLRPGSNSVRIAEPDFGSYEVVVPNGTELFGLTQKRSYVLEVWGGWGLRSEVRFTM